MPQTKLSAITNNGLFSNDYILNRLPRLADWKGMAPHRNLLEQVRIVFREAGHLLETANERQIREEVINKILAMVSPYYLSDQNLPTGGTPDYIFFRDIEAKQRKDLISAIAVGDAKEPGKDFDKAVGERSPVRQVYDYMADTQTRWGVLTDGSRWRLLNHDSPTDRYFEIDLRDTVGRNDEDEWLYFYNLFRQEAFVPSEGKCFLDLVKEESTRYTQAVGEELKERVYSALRELAIGFALWPENNLDASREDVRGSIRDSCFILLYRLLFIFYAETRNLLPKDEHGYHQLSLETLREKVKGASRDGSRFLADSRRLWIGLEDLFRLIDQGNAELRVPPYNGGLFSRQSRGLESLDFLEKYEISDKYLARAIDLLGTAPSLEKKNVFVNVDYAGLEIRHLGSIYEGLLEYRLGFAETDLVSVRDGKGERWVSVDEYEGNLPIGRMPSEMKVKKGEMYLETEKHERKVTGSYYTPDYIVKYIVERTLGPIVSEKTEAASKRHSKRSDAVLSIKVCDPAMGSGHFLVEAVEYLAEALLQAVEEDQRAGLSAEDEYGIEWARREVVRHCIYGVDLNELAVELAKVSLWLTTISREKPLSFLDHRLKCGNSIIGARLADLKEYPQVGGTKTKRRKATSMPAFISQIFIERLISKVRELEGIGDDRLEDIRKKEEVLAEFKQLAEYEKTKAIADVRTSTYFGNEVAPTQKKDSKDVYYDLIYSLDYPSNWEPKTRTSWFRRAQEIAENRKFFHWELEFPDVFFGGEQSGAGEGFDAVIGNPPYVRIYRGQISEEDRAYYTRVFESAHMKFDLYLLFVELGLDILGSTGRFAMIIPDKWMSSPYGEPLRRKILDWKLVELADLRGIRVFEDVAVDNVIPVIAKTPCGEEEVTEILRGQVDSSGSVIISPVNRVRQEVFGEFPQSQIRPEITDLSASLLRKIEDKSIKLGQICYVNWGLRTGTAAKTKAMISDKKVKPRYKHLIRGEDITERYCLVRAKRFIDYDVSQLYNPMFPEFFENPKLVFRKISGSRGILATLDEGKSYCFSTVIIALRHTHLKGVKRPGVIAPTPESREYDDMGYLLAMVNSSLIRWYYDMLLSDKLSVVPNHVKELPLRRISFEVSKENRSEVVQLARPLYDKYLQTGELEEWHDFLCNRLNSEQDETVHDILAFLARHMTQTQEEKYGHMRAFLDWVESPAGLGVKVEELRNKTKIQRFHEHPMLGYDEALKELETVFAQNKITIGAEGLAAFRKEYSRVAQLLGPLLQRASLVDTLIDLSVYRLYGLAEDDIAIIEDLALNEVRSKYQWPSGR